ncbi:hypothetical protein GGX14DRAFT_427012, partial [Mycena pura]
GRSLVLAAAVSLLSWASCIYSVKASMVIRIAPLSLAVKKLSIAANSLSAATDVTISIVLVLLLNSSKTGFKRSTDLINRLMVFTFNTVGRFYTNSLLVTLNSREYIKSSSHHASGEQYSLDESGRRSGRIDQPTRDQITIRIDKDTLHEHSHFPGEDLKSAQ